MRGIRREVERTKKVPWKSYCVAWEQTLSCGHVIHVPDGAQSIGIETVKYRFCKKCLTDAL